MEIVKEMRVVGIVVMKEAVSMKKGGNGDTLNGGNGESGLYEGNRGNSCLWNSGNGESSLYGCSGGNGGRWNDGNGVNGGTWNGWKN
ncbi:Hypothetical predicted protein [Mytilus galloprovincialis]|uniref:Uncharacterized protein n=1 Tax=Mytilus galloprovincialis TaxID=29158 RepID=A0A8B6EG23_MYTGA|nr:Hypothetical predicted protein [Mytilus galloprovincialis]